MGEARNIIITFLVLLFIIIGLGVLFSRLSKERGDKSILGGVLDNVFFSRSLKTTPTPTPTKGSTAITIRTTGTPLTPSQMQGNTSKGGIVETPQSIPATGTPTVAILLSGAGLASGLALRKFSRQ